MFDEETIAKADEVFPGMGSILRGQNLSEARKIEQLEIVNDAHGMGSNAKSTTGFYQQFGFENGEAPMRAAHLFTESIVTTVMKLIASGEEVDIAAAMAGLWADGMLCGLAVAEIRERDERQAAWERDGKDQ